MSINNSRSINTIKKLEALAGEKFTMGSYIAAIREGEEMTQVQFAKLLGITKQNLCDIEHNRRLISPKLAARFAKKLGYGVNQFVRLALQALVDKDGIPVNIEVKAA